MVKLVKAPDWLYRNCIYDKKEGIKLSKILRNIDRWESSGKIKYRFDIYENLEIISERNLRNLEVTALRSENIDDQVSIPVKDVADHCYILNMMVHNTILNDILFLINYILSKQKIQNITRLPYNLFNRYLFDDNFYFINRLNHEIAIPAFFDCNDGYVLIVMMVMKLILCLNGIVLS